MPSDPFAPVGPGDAPDFIAVRENAIRASARAYMNGRIMRQSFDGPATNIRGDIVRVLNTTGADVGRRAILGLDGPSFDPSTNLDQFLQAVVFKGVVPTDSHRGRFAVMLNPTKDKQVGQGIVSGFCGVQVKVLAAGHCYAEALKGDATQLVSCGCGSAKIITIDGGGAAPFCDNAFTNTTGSKWAYVRLGNEGGRARACMPPAGGIPAAVGAGTTPGRATCPMYDWNGSTWVPDLTSETVFNNGGGPTSGGKIVLVVYHQGTPFAVVDQC